MLSTKKEVDNMLCYALYVNGKYFGHLFGDTMSEVCYNGFYFWELSNQGEVVFSIRTANCKVDTIEQIVRLKY